MQKLNPARRARGWRESGVALLSAACLATLSASPLAAAEAEVNIDNFAFAPAELTVKVGATVTFRNRDDIPHSVVSSNQSFHSSALDTDETFSFAFEKPGTYEYFCGLHPKMTGKIIVAP
ncbi:cupredoxin domain-containing protein [Methylocapsa acidiphila]|uniref:cupredoxin domain-containing protein n=1 Tax=Methylocapsa acidiphila TaxID=133552 RepID=UPI0004174DEE|nr:cupredoxin family copper-binding protein [Methylocapsa acidiphila]